MATYKLDIAQQFGSFKHRLYAAGEAAPEFGGQHRSREELVAAVDASLAALAMGSGDEVVFRGIAHESRPAVCALVRDAPC